MWARYKVKSFIYCVNQFLCEKRHKKWNQECKQKLSRMLNFCNILDLLTSRIQKIAWWTPVFKPDFHIFPYNEQLRKISRNFIDKFLLCHTSLRQKLNRITGLLAKLRHWVSSSLIKTIYFALCDSYLCYTVQVWRQSSSNVVYIIKWTQN